MSSENFNTSPENTQTPPGNKIKKTPEELEAKFNLSRKVLSSLAVAAAALTSTGNVEAGGAMPVPMDTPGLQKISESLKGAELSILPVTTLFSFILQTNKGDISLETSKQVGEDHQKYLERVLKDISPKKILNEIERQKKSSLGTQDQVTTPHGQFTVEISPYAEATLKEYGVTYSKGKLSNGKTSLDLTGSDSSNPRVNCKIGRWGEFNDFVKADCTEMKVINGKPSISSITYKINGQTLTLEVAEK